MRTKWGLAVAAVVAAVGVVLAVAGIVGAASAQVPAKERGERYTELLAEELGVTVEELETARKAARDQVIDEALAAGEITAEQAERLKSLEPGEGPRFGIGRHMAGHKLGRALVSVFEAAAEVVGLPVDELRERIRGGESLTDIAASEGMDETELKDGLMEALADRINDAVENGELSRERADLLLDRLDALVERGINAEVPFEPPFERFQGRQDFRGPDEKN